MIRFLSFSLTLLLVLMLVNGCSTTPTAEVGDTVKVHYTGTLDDGEEFDSSRDSEPLEFTIGSGSMIQGFNDAVIGMKVGDIKDVSIPMEQAYGPIREQMIANFPRDQLPEDFTPEKGMQLQMQRQDGSPMVVTIVDFTEDSVLIDGNHPLAGQNLNFEIELVEIVENDG